MESAQRSGAFTAGESVPGASRRGRRSRNALVALTGATALAILAPAPASAQTVPTRDELEGVTEAPPATLPRLSIEGGIERSPCALADPDYADVTVQVSNVTFNNLKGASPAELEPAWRPFTAGPQPVAVLCEIRDAAAR